MAIISLDFFFSLRVAIFIAFKKQIKPEARYALFLFVIMGNYYEYLSSIIIFGLHATASFFKYVLWIRFPWI